MNASRVAENLSKSFANSWRLPAEIAASTGAGVHCLRPVRAALNVFSRPALLSGIGTRPSHDLFDQAGAGGGIPSSSCGPFIASGKLARAAWAAYPARRGLASEFLPGSGWCANQPGGGMITDDHHRGGENYSGHWAVPVALASSAFAAAFAALRCASRAMTARFRYLSIAFGEEETGLIG